MPTMEYHLYRAKFIKPNQLTLFEEDRSPSDFFSASLAEKPTATFKKEHAWHIGNIEYFNENKGSFAVGRTTKATVERYDDESGNFLEQLDDSGPYTYVLFDKSIGLLGIAKKTKVAPDVQSIARKIKTLLENTNAIKEYGIEVRVDIIPDPENFIQKIKNAYAVKRFKAFFTGPNPIDADEIFQKPLSIYCQTLNAEHGSVDVEGQALNEDSIEAVAKSTASTGNTASAKIQTHKGRKSITVKLKGDAVRISVDAELEKSEVLSEIKNAYQRVRG